MTNDDHLTPRERASLSDAIDAGIDNLEHRRRRRTLALTGGAAAVLVAAVVGTSVFASGALSGGTVAATPTVVASPTPTPTSAPTTPASTPPATTPPATTVPPTATADPADPAQWRVTDEGIGPVKLGEGILDAVAGFPDAATCRPDGDPAWIAENGSLWLVRDYEGDPDTVGVVSWDRYDNDAPDFTVGPRTDRGIGIGATEAEVRAAYPDAQYTVTDEGRLIARDGLVTMRTRDGVVVQLAVSRMLPGEFCG
ncbi:hypothetical protein [Microbacterium testaceum]|uniref:hypothetical protein n=1 Tax=Microbacterium testaceum TaxID=2033 RepID=UPI0012AC7D20|nr:hypothetical protein [Microbacterium testaceum]